MSASFTGQFSILPQIKSVKYLTRSVCFIYKLFIKFTPDQLSKFADT